jgi:IS5 family transposase
MSMGFKKTTRNLDFADLALATCMEQNRSVKLMEQLNNTINWKRVEPILLSHYTVGTSEEGARAYPPLMLFKCLMLQKWFRIPSDPELENQITDRLSFKTFLGLSFSQPAPDHSTFSRFRSRLPKEAMDAINSEILRQFEQQGLSINEGVAVDARLVKSASRPLSQDELKKQLEHRQTEEGQRDNNGKLLKFSRDLESDWTVRNDTPHFGLKEHTSVDAKHGFVLATTLTPASVNDTNLLPYCTAFSRHTKRAIKKVYADKGYAGEPNRDFLALNRHYAQGLHHGQTHRLRDPAQQAHRQNPIHRGAILRHQPPA